jgi:hypothetical protein
MSFIRYKFAAPKALAAIHWMLTQRKNVDLHTMLKAIYFADKAHLNKHGRPIFGATYRAMKFGPVPIEIYEMAKGEPLWLAELKLEKLPWRLSNYFLELDANTAPDLSVLSATDLEELGRGFNLSSKLSFDSRTAVTHGRDWQRANLGTIRYEDMLDDGPDLDRRIQYLRDTAATFRL